MSLYYFTTLLAASVAAAQCAGESCMDNGMGSIMNPGTNASGAMMTQWMTGGSGSTWQMVATPMTFSENTAPQVINVTVGGSAGKVYTPNTVTANVGDIIQFNFQDMNHTATQSGFDTPCIAMTDGVQSGFMPNPDDTNPNPAIQMQVTVSTPLWFYCQQTGHCGSGMVFSVNPTADKSQDDFIANAMAQNGTTTSSVAPPVATSSVVAGTGSVDSSGACECQCLCGTNDYASGYGIGMSGGYGGMLSVSSMAAPPPVETMVSSDMSYVAPPPSVETVVSSGSSYSGYSGYEAPPPPMESVVSSDSGYMAPPVAPPMETVISASSGMMDSCPGGYC